MPPPYKKVSAFIDWNSQLLLTGINIKANPVGAAEIALKDVARRIVKCLTEIEKNEPFKVNVRLYHGWHKGYEETVNSKAIRSVISKIDFSSLSTKPNVVFNDGIGFGSCLISALPSRMHIKPAIHLPNTLRNKIKSKEVEEKMVDTALATDLIVTAYAEPTGWILLASEDDDLVPSLFSAEAAVQRTGARVLLLSNRVRSKNFLLLDNICI